MENENNACENITPVKLIISQNPFSNISVLISKNIQIELFQTILHQTNKIQVFGQSFD
jgi:hypothetical protein